ncbi:MAG: class I SAM-dependent methyltransferase, partial [Acidobacteria bacterium]|nr:class I SAM-dependent methyltransferase [Acidobacteriota bacterium]
AALSARPHAARVIGVDFSDGMLRRALHKVRRRGYSRTFGLVRGDAACLPVRSGSMDAATVAFGLRNVERLSAALAEIHRVLAVGGRLAVLEFAIPEAGVIRAVYLCYFTRVLPAIGRVLSGHGSAYAYLPASVQAFLPPGAIAALLGDHGFSSVAAVRLTAGIVYLYVGTKSAGPVRGPVRRPGSAAGGCYNR